MEKLKLLGILLIIVILFQIPFLTDHDDIYPIFNMILTVLVYLIGIKNINKDTPLKKCILYGFVLLWCVLIVLISYCMRGHYLKSFSIIDAGWEYSVIIVFIISKILSLEVIQDDSKYLIITTLVLFIVGALIGYGIEYVENYVMDVDSLDMFLEIEYYINIGLFSILFFYVLKINIEEKKFIILSICISIIIILTLNIIPIQKINSIISYQEELCTIINSNLTTYTYKNISTELGQYLPNNEVEELTTQMWDYQQYDMINESYLSIIGYWLQNINRTNFNDVIETIQDVPSQLNTFINSGELARNYRITSIIVSSIIVIYIGAYLLLKENEKYSNI